MGFKTKKRAEGPKHVGEVMQVTGSGDTLRNSQEVSGAPTVQGMRPPEGRRGRRQKNAELALGAPRGANSLPWPDNPANGMGLPERQRR